MTNQSGSSKELRDENPIIILLNNNQDNDAEKTRSTAYLKNWLEQLNELIINVFDNPKLFYEYVRDKNDHKILLLIDDNEQILLDNLDENINILIIRLDCNKIIYNQEQVKCYIRKTIRLFSRQEIKLNYLVLDEEDKRNQEQNTVRYITKDSASFLWFQLIVDILKRMPTNTESAKNEMLDD